LDFFFATFAEMIKYPRPDCSQCTYAFDASSQAISNDVKNRVMSEIKREISRKLSSDPDTKNTLSTMQTQNGYFPPSKQNALATESKWMIRMSVSAQLWSQDSFKILKPGTDTQTFWNTLVNIRCTLNLDEP